MTSAAPLSSPAPMVSASGEAWTDGDEDRTAAREVASKKSQAGMRGYPVGTIAFYGPYNPRASKVAVSRIQAEGAKSELRR